MDYLLFVIVSSKGGAGSAEPGSVSQEKRLSLKTG